MKGQSCEIVRITIFTMQLIFSNTKVKEYLQTGAFRVKFRWRQFLCGFRRITLFDWISNETPSLNFISYWPYDIIPGIRLNLAPVIRGSVWDSAKRSNTPKLTRKIAFLDDFQTKRFYLKICFYLYFQLWKGFRSILQFCIATTMIIKLAPPELLFVSVGGIVTIMGVSR